MALTKEQLEKLLGEVKAYLNITWDDENTDNKIHNCIISSTVRLNSIAGVELDYTGFNFTERQPLLQEMDMLGRELLLARCFYLNEKALDDFEKNYRGELLTLANKGKVYLKNA